MRPTIDEVLEGVEVSFARDLLPEIKTEWGQRIAAAILESIAHVRLRLAHERRLLAEELADLRGLCADVGLPLAPHGPPQAGPSEAEGVEEEAMRLRGTVEEALRSGRIAAGESEESWQAVLAYLGRQLDRERQLLPGR